MIDNLSYILGRENDLFNKDLQKYEKIILEEIKNSSILLIGGAGSIGSALAIELFKKNPKKLHIVDISENSNVELVRVIRSTLGYIDGDFQSFSIDCANTEFELLLANHDYDYVFNFSALKHVRSEKDPYSLMRMINVNILNTIKIMKLLRKKKIKKFFCVSSDKATNPVNMMGASKRIMEMFLFNENNLKISTARFANVAFSEGSLLHSFTKRYSRKEPISAPYDVKRYFITSKESAALCLLSGILANNRETYFPKLLNDKHLMKFSDIAQKYLNNLGYKPFLCKSEEEARNSTLDLINKKMWPCYFFKSDTTGEKDFEEFFSSSEEIQLNLYNSIGVIKNTNDIDPLKLDNFLSEINKLLAKKKWNKIDILDIFKDLIPNFEHIEKDKSLDQKM